MANSIVLLRGVNLGPSNRIAMPALRAALADAGFENARTHAQSGNIVVAAGPDGSELSDRVEELIAERFGLIVPAVVRSAEELAHVVAENPFEEPAEQQPKRFQVTFLRGVAPAGLEDRLRPLAAPAERVAVRGREIYAWHPDGVGRSRLALKLAARAGLGPGVTATSRNWATIGALLEMAVSDAG